MSSSKNSRNQTYEQQNPELGMNGKRGTEIQCIKPDYMVERITAKYEGARTISC